MDNKIISIADVTSIRELNQSVDKAYDLYCADNKTLFMNWLKSRNWQPFDSMDFDIGAKSFMNIKAKIINNVTITRPKEGAKDKRITGSTKKGFMPDGKIYNTKGKTEDEIYEKVTKEYIKRRKQLKHKPTIADLLDKALAFKQKIGGQKDATIKIDRQNYESFLRGSTLEAMPIEDIKLRHIEDFIIDELIPKYIAKRKDKSKPTSSDVDKKLTVLREIFYYAVREEIISMNPFMTGQIKYGAAVARPNEKRTEDATFTKEQLDLISKHCLDTYTNGRYHNTANLAVIFISYTGLRVGEAAALKWEDCHLNEAVPYVRTERQEDNAHNITDVKCESEAGHRNIPLPPQAIEILKLLKKNTKDNSEWVFTQADGTRKTKAQIRHALENAIEHEPDIKKIKGKGTHALRKTYCSELLASGMQLKTVQKIMGHKDANTTMKYYAFDISSLEEQSEGINRTFAFEKIS